MSANTVTVRLNTLKESGWPYLSVEFICANFIFLLILQCVTLDRNAKLLFCIMPIVLLAKAFYRFNKRDYGSIDLSDSGLTLHSKSRGWDNMIIRKEDIKEIRIFNIADRSVKISDGINSYNVNPCIDEFGIFIEWVNRNVSEDLFTKFIKSFNGIVEVK